MLQNIQSATELNEMVGYLISSFKTDTKYTNSVQICKYNIKLK